jgi:holliday junction DNA helicase RuvA
MIEYIAGKLVEATPTYAVIETHGVGYKLHISLITFSSLRVGEPTKLFVYEAIREDAHLLFGFHHPSERACFELLISVSGVGANTARVILSSLSVAEIEQAVSTGNVNLLKSVKGIGAKTAERIIVDLKGKIKFDASMLPAGTLPAAATTALENEALEALVTLGFVRAASQKVVAKLLREQPQLRVEEVIKHALKML